MTNLSFDEARDLWLSLGSPGAAERVSVFEADGRVLAEDVVAPFPLPPFDYSAMDGYAVSASGVPDSLELAVEGTSAAGGELPTFRPGTACRIFTGAPLPDGADSVVMQENVEVLAGGKAVRLAQAPSPGQNVRRRGEDLADGTVAIPRGARLEPGPLALAAALERATLVCHRRPVVTVLSSGDELRSPGDPPRAGSVIESNGLFITATGRRAGAIVHLAPFVRDDLEATTRAVAGALRVSDLVVTVGGVSVGDRDLVRAAVEAAGVEVLFHRIAIKPGRPVLGGRHPGGARLLGLPGNPASASLTFLLFGVPMVRKLAGEGRPLPATCRATVVGKAKSAEGRTDFLRGRLDSTAESAPRFVLAPNQASGAVTSFAGADALAVVPPGRIAVQDGDVLDVIRIADIA